MSVFLVAASRRVLAPVHSSVCLPLSGCFLDRYTESCRSSRALSLSLFHSLFSLSLFSLERERSTHARTCRARMCKDVVRANAPSTLGSFDSVRESCSCSCTLGGGTQALGEFAAPLESVRLSVLPLASFLVLLPPPYLPLPPPCSPRALVLLVLAAAVAAAAAAAAAAAPRPLPPLVSSSTSFQLVLSILGRRQLPLSKSPVETCTC